MEYSSKQIMQKELLIKNMVLCNKILILFWLECKIIYSKNKEQGNIKERYLICGWNTINDENMCIELFNIKLL